ncbi:MAG: ATP-dependent DNA ligase [Acidimicrobiales bacterium]
MLFADLVATSGAVAATRARSKKVAALADLLRRLSPAEIAVATAVLAGQPRQGKVGIGWASVAAVDRAAAVEPTLTIVEVDEAITLLQGTIGPGSAAARAGLLGELLGRATEAEADFLRRLLVGELRQGALEGVVTDAVAVAASIPGAAVRRASMLAGDLPTVAQLALTGGESRLAEIGLRLLNPIRPMLAASANDVAEALALTGPASVEWKLDGARIQVHRSGPDVRIYTRNLNDITGRVPGIVAAVRSLPVGQVILDGEAIGLDEGEQAGPGMFQDTMSRFGRQDGVAGATLGARFFDCLHVDGQDLIDHPLSDRLDILERVAGQWRIPGQVTGDPAEGEGVLAEALAAGHEGVMVKAIGSTYDAGRRGGSWRKVKPVRTLDLVVLAAEWGHGRRQGWLSNLHLGARDPDTAGRFVMVGKTFKGLTDELLTWQTEQLQALRVDTDPEGYVVEVRPELVVEVALDGVQVSTRYPGGVALRFARVRRYRPDKVAAEADTIDVVQAMLPGRG